MLCSYLCLNLVLILVEVAGTDSVAVVEDSGTIEEGTSCSDEATDEDRHSVVVIGKVKAVGAY